MTKEETEQEWSINRRTAMKSAGAASGAVLLGSSFSGVAAARGGGKPCHKVFECEVDEYVKIEFVEYYDEAEEEYVCYFEEETDTGLIEITNWENKDGEECEPISVEWEADGYVAAKVMAFGGNDCDTVENPGTSYTSGLENSGGNTAAISNLQFCLEETAFPECPFYGTSREDPTEIVSIRYDPNDDEIVETSVGTIPDESDNSNYPNGLAFDDENDDWYFAEEGGILKTMNEDGSLGIKEYGGISGGADIAGAAFWDDQGEYLFIQNGTNKLMAADISSGVAETREVADLNWSNIGLGDLAIDEDTGVLYVSTTRSSVGPNFFSVDLNDTSVQELIVEAPADSTEFAAGKQIAFAEGSLWAHEASGGSWWTVDTDDGSLSEDVVATTREYTDLAGCGDAEWMVEQ